MTYVIERYKTMTKILMFGPSVKDGPKTVNYIEAKPETLNLLQRSSQILGAFRADGIGPQQALKTLFPETKINSNWPLNIDWVEATFIVYLEAKKELSKEVYV